MTTATEDTIDLEAVREQLAAERPKPPPPPPPTGHARHGWRGGKEGHLRPSGLIGVKW